MCTLVPPLYNYRPDIDGLRAIAVLSVVLFHAFPDWSTGGFIGVDIFFVISGYLISKLIFEGFAHGTFDFIVFYTRRVKRIFPSLITVLATCLFIGWISLDQEEYKQLTKHIFGGSIFASNFLLWSEAGYFDNSAETKPLLHLWSLGIEEQFYLAWPVLLWAAHKRKINFLLPIILGFSISFAANVYLAKMDPIGAFYLPQTRFWELIFGSILGWQGVYKPAFALKKTKQVETWIFANKYIRALTIDEKTLANASSGIGFCLLIYGFYKIDKTVAFPGKWAIIPTLSSALIIAAGPQAWINRTILSHKALVWIGLISFPIYLWHWPLFSFAKIIERRMLGELETTFIILLSVLFAWITYIFIERPIRKESPGSKKGTVLMALMLLIGGAAYILSSRIQTQAQFEQTLKDYKSNCFDHSFSQRLLDGCLFQTKNTNTIALVGDSHAGHLFAGLIKESTDDNGVALFNFACQPPFIDIALKSGGNNPDIRPENHLLVKNYFDYIFKNQKINTVILAHHPQCSYNNVIDLKDKELSTSFDVLYSGMYRTVKSLVESNKRVIIILDNPYLPFNPKVCSSRPLKSAQNLNCAFDRKIFDEDLALQEYRAIANDIFVRFPSTTIIDLSNYMCDEVSCFGARNGAVLYQDSGHLNIDGSRFIGQKIADSIFSPNLKNAR